MALRWTKRGRKRHEWQAMRGAGGKLGIMFRLDRLRGNTVPPPCRTLFDMSEAEIIRLEREYGAPVLRPQAR